MKDHYLILRIQTVNLSYKKGIWKNIKPKIIQKRNKLLINSIKSKFDDAKIINIDNGFAAVYNDTKEECLLAQTKFDSKLIPRLNKLNIVVTTEVLKENKYLLVEI